MAAETSHQENARHSPALPNVPVTREEMVRLVQRIRRMKRQDAEDVVQETLLALHKSGSLDLASDAYITTVLRNISGKQLYDTIRQREIAVELHAAPEGTTGVEVCKNGHIRTPETLRINAEGYRVCLLCTRLTQRRHYQRKRPLLLSAYPHRHSLNQSADG